MITAGILGLIAGVFMAWVNLSNHELHRLNTPTALNSGLIKLILGTAPFVLIIFSFIQLGIVEGLVSIGAALVSHTFVWTRAERKMRKIVGEPETRHTSVNHKATPQHLAKTATATQEGYDYLVNKYLPKEDRSHSTKKQIGIKTSPTMILVGVGGAGIATINRISKYDKLPIKKYIAIDSDVTALRSSNATTKIKLSKSEGFPTDIDSKMKVHEVSDEIAESANGADVAFLVFGTGGNTSASAWSIVANTLKERGVLVVVFAIKPFSFEDDSKKLNSAVVSELKDSVDVIVEVSNDRMIESSPSSVPMHESFKTMDNALVGGIDSVYDEIKANGLKSSSKIKALMDNASRDFLDK